MALDLADKSGNGNTLTNNGADDDTADTPFPESGHSADTVLANSDYFNAGTGSSLKITGTITVECYVKFSQLSSTIGNIQCLITKGDANGFFSYQLYPSTDDKLYFIACTDGTFSHFCGWRTTTYTITTGTWIHIAATLDPSTNTAHIYIDGVDKAITDISVSPGTSIYDSTIGAYVCARYNSAVGGDNIGADKLDGKIDEVRIWNVIRTGTQISTNYRRELTGKEQNLVAYWPFEFGLPHNIGFITNHLHPRAFGPSLAR